MSEVMKYVDDMRTLLQESSLTERKAFMKSFVRETVVMWKETVLRYTLPILRSSA
jgi:hypothetical protein